MRKAALGVAVARHGADLIEGIFGPDPGLLRLQMAWRSVLSVGVTLLVLVRLMNIGLMPMAGVALGFMVSLFASTLVRESERSAQLVTFLLLAVPPVPSITAASFLAQRQWAMDLGFVALVVAVTFARQAGPRGIAMGMTAYISYFLGAIMHPEMAELPQLAGAVMVGLGGAALVRFWILPERPHATLQQAARHLERRVGRILDAVRAHLRSEGPVHFGTRSDTRLHREMARLNDAVLIAEEQAGSLPGSQEASVTPVSAALFGLDLAAERVIRTASLRPFPPPQRRIVEQRIAALQARLGHDAASLVPDKIPDGESRLACLCTEPLVGAVDRLEEALAALKRAIAATESDSICRAR